MVVDYKKGRIYKIYSNQTEQIYVGSTCQPLSHRMCTHRALYNRYQNGLGKYITSFEIVKYDDAKIELLEVCSCDNKEELNAREGHYIRTTNCVNKNIPDRTRAEYNTLRYQENKQSYLDANKIYYQENKDRILERVECTCGRFVSRAALNAHKRSQVHINTMAQQNHMVTLPVEVVETDPADADNLIINYSKITL